MTVIAIINFNWLKLITIKLKEFYSLTCKYTLEWYCGKHMDDVTQMKLT